MGYANAWIVIRIVIARIEMPVIGGIVSNRSCVIGTTATPKKADSVEMVRLYLLGGVQQLTVVMMKIVDLPPFSKIRFLNEKLYLASQDKHLSNINTRRS